MLHFWYTTIVSTVLFMLWTIHLDKSFFCVLILWRRVCALAQISIHIFKLQNLCYILGTSQLLFNAILKNGLVQNVCSKKNIVKFVWMSQCQFRKSNLTILPHNFTSHVMGLWELQRNPEESLKRNCEEIFLVLKCFCWCWQKLQASNCGSDTLW